ncbi:hypothetical protein AMELA_G00221270, partial [Ameiurus melas]
MRCMTSWENQENWTLADSRRRFPSSTSTKQASDTISISSTTIAGTNTVPVRICSRVIYSM